MGCADSKPVLQKPGSAARPVRSAQQDAANGKASPAGEKGKQQQQQQHQQQPQQPSLQPASRGCSPRGSKDDGEISPSGLGSTAGGRNRRFLPQPTITSPGVDGLLRTSPFAVASAKTNFCEKEESEIAITTIASPTIGEPKNLVPGRMVLYTHPLSQPCLSVVWFLRHNKIDCCYLEVDLRAGEHLSDKFRIMNPTGEVPLLKNGDMCLAQSSAILVYLASKERADDGVVSFDARQEFEAGNERYNAIEHRARVNEYIGRHHTLVRRFTTDCVSPVLFAEEGERERAREAGVEAVRPLLDFWEGVLSGQTHVVGDSLSICDFLFTPEVLQLQVMGVLSQRGFPSLTAYLQRMSQVAGFAESTKEFSYLLKHTIPRRR